MDYQRGSLVNTDSGMNVYCANGLNWILRSYPSLRRNWTLCLNHQCWHFEGVFFSNVVIRYRGAGANEKESQKIIETKQTVITIAIKKEKNLLAQMKRLELNIDCWQLTLRACVFLPDTPFSHHSCDVTPHLNQTRIESVSRYSPQAQVDHYLLANRICLKVWDTFRRTCTGA